jgi:polysaccharide biosynthesis/export protein
MMTAAARTAWSRRSRHLAASASVVAVLIAAPMPAVGQAQAPPSMPATATRAPLASPASTGASTDYVIGPTDVLSVVFWREKDLSLDVVVRPDGKISLPLLNDVQAAGFTPEQLRRVLGEAAKRFLEEPVVTIVVKQVNNNRVFITGEVQHPGPFVLPGPATVLQLLAMAGGFTDFADRKHILITRLENGAQRSFSFNYDDVVKHRALEQNILLKPGDTVVVP